MFSSAVVLVGFLLAAGEAPPAPNADFFAPPSMVRVETQCYFASAQAAPAAPSQCGGIRWRRELFPNRWRLLPRPRHRC